jgi:hypothetical protein
VFFPQTTLMLVSDGKLLFPPSPEPISGMQNGDNLLVTHLPGTGSIQDGKPIRIGFSGLGLDALDAQVTFLILRGRHGSLLRVQFARLSIRI